MEHQEEDLNPYSDDEEQQEVGKKKSEGDQKTYGISYLVADLLIALLEEVTQLSIPQDSRTFS